jgi:hypothetical protein
MEVSNMQHNELYHFGVKGMKWGVRKKNYYEESDRKKKIMKEAKVDMNSARIDKKNKQVTYSRTFDAATRVRNQFGARGKAYDKALVETAEASRNADKAYKQSKKAYKQAKKDYREQKNIDTYKKHGLDYGNLDHVANVYSFGLRGAKRIENRIANKGMSRLKSEMIEVGRSAATSTLTAIGTIAVAGAVSYLSNPKQQILDSAGKVIRNMY